MAITKLNSQAIPPNTIVESDLSYPLTNFSSTGIDDNADALMVELHSFGTSPASHEIRMKDQMTVVDSVEISGNGNTTLSLKADQIGLNGSGPHTWAIQSQNTGKLEVSSSTGAGSELLVIDTAGNVGINESAPDELLHVKGPDEATIKIEATGSQFPTAYDGTPRLMLVPMATNGFTGEAIIEASSPSDLLSSTGLVFRAARSQNQLGGSYNGGYFSFHDGNTQVCSISDQGIEAANFRATSGGTTALTLSATGRVSTGENLEVAGDLTVDTSTLAVDSTNNRVGVGIASPSTPLHVRSGSSTGASASPYALLALEGANPPTLQFLSANNTLSQIRFGDPESDGSGGLDYNHSTDQMNFWTNGSYRLSINSSGNATFSGNVTAPQGVFTGTGDSIVVRDASPQIKWESTTAGDTDYWWHLGSTGVFYCLADRTSDGSWEGPYPIQMDAANNYIKFYDTAEIKPAIGQYGSFHIDGGATGGYEGFSIGGRVVFMHNNSTRSGIYNDVNNQWILRATHNAETGLWHAGAQKIYTYSSGGRITGNLLATSNVYAYYSDERLKEKTGKIENALDKVDAIETFYYTHNDIANELGYEGKEQQVGVSAQSVESVMPEVVHLAPIDDDGEGNSVSGENYQTVDYPRLVPLLLEAIKELRSEVEALKNGSPV